MAISKRTRGLISRQAANALGKGWLANAIRLSGNTLTLRGVLITFRR